MHRRRSAKLYLPGSSSEDNEEDKGTNEGKNEEESEEEDYMAETFATCDDKA